MDRECVTLLPRVCELLAASGSALPDDTSLEKLLDWFTQLSKAGTSLHECFPCLLEFISSVTDNTAADPAIIAFMIKLTGLLAATVAGFQILQDRSTLDQVFCIKHWQETGVWEDPSVKSGWVHGLRSMMQHPRALSLFIQSELMEHLLQLQTDSSLFVASSATQLLAHILLFYQPELSITNGKHHPQEDDHRAHNGVGPSACLSTEHKAAVMAACVYLREFLPPKEQKSLQHSARLLRVVAQVLSEASPPLCGQIFEAVCGSLEDLVTAGHSHLTLPLMEVILAAQSSLSQVQHSAGRLLCAMLEVRQPTERIRAATAILQEGFCDPVYSPKAARILLLPLNIITGQSLLGSDATGEAQGQIQEELQNKSSFMSMMCMCVADIHHIALLPPDLQPCSPALIVSTVVSLLRLSTGDSSLSPGCAEANKHIYGNGKIQKCALEALTALSNCSDKEKVIEVCTVLLQYLNNPDSEPIVLHKCYQALLKWTSSRANRALVSEELRQDLERLVQKRVCDLRWEVRDSTVEFLGQQAVQTPSAVEPSQGPLLLLEERSTVPLLREALQDQESYVRASAVSALAQTLQRSWQQGAVVSQEQADIVTKLLSILCEDTEGFSRRAVVQFFISWFSHSSSSSSSSSPPLLTTSIPSVLSRGSSDLDWEVKVHTLELAKLLLADSTLTGRTQPSHPYAVVSRPTFPPRYSSSDDALEKLVESGVISALLSGLFDCDRPVALKACLLLIKLRETLDRSAGESAAKCHLPSWGWGLEIRALSENFNGADLVNLDEVLRCLNLEERLDVLSQSSDHVQNSPLSLLKDILTARDVHCHPNTGEGQEVIVDCY